MCTSFAFREKMVLIGMNFDNDGKEFKVVLKDQNQFIILVNVNGSFYPSFGIHRNGTFINDLLVDSNGEGKYKRQNENRWVTTSLVGKVLAEEVTFAELYDLLQQKTIVNAPNSSTHCMVVDRGGNVHIIEPGRKNIFSPSDDSPFYVMTNFPLSEFEPLHPDQVQGSGADRYKAVHHLLSDVNGTFDIEAAFDVLASARQDQGDWITEFSMVAVPNEETVYFSINGDFTKRFKFSFKDHTISTVKGFEQHHNLVLTAKGFKKAELENEAEF